MVNLFYASNPRSILSYRHIIRVTGGRKVLFLQAATTEALSEARLKAAEIRAILDGVDDVWVTNERLREWVESLHLVVPVSIVSPFVSLIQDYGSAELPEATTVIATSCWEGGQVYGVQLTVDAVARLRQSQPDARLIVLLYGRNTLKSREMAMALEATPWVRVVQGADEETVEQILGTCDALVRASSSDGDSLIVRRALSLGRRVLASDVVPRPTGVELFSLSSEDLLAALECPRRRTSDGAGLGPSVLTTVLELASQIR